MPQMGVSIGAGSEGGGSNGGDPHVIVDIDDDPDNSGSALVTTEAPHGLTDGALISISGSSDPGVEYNGDCIAVVDGRTSVFRFKASNLSSPVAYGLESEGGRWDFR